MARWTPVQIAGGAYSDDARPWAHQDTVNYLPVPAESAGTRSPALLRSAPGFTTFCATMQDAPIRGLHNAEGLLLAVAGDTLYRIGTDGAATSIGVIPGVDRVSMAHNQVTYGHEVMIANGQSGYVYNTFSGAFGQVTDDGFSGFTVCDFVDGYIAGIEPQGRFWAHSMLRQAGSYNTLDRYDAESAPDRMQSLIVSHREVMVLNQRTAAFFRNTGATTGTFQNSNGTELDIGCASPFAVARLDNTVYWLGNDGVVYRLDGHNGTRVSTGPIEQAISRCDTSKAFAFTFEDRGHKVFYLTLPDGQTWGYDVWGGEWHRRQSQGFDRWRLSALVKWNGAWIGGDFSNGKLYQLDWAVQHEAGAEMEKRRIVSGLHDNENRLTVNALKLVIDTGMGQSGVQSVLPPLSLSGDLPDGYVGDSGTYQYTASGGVLPRTFTVASGALPAGATMGDDGLVTFSYSAPGSYAWVVRVTDGDGEIAEVSDTAIIGAVDLISGASAAVFRVYSGDTVNFVQQSEHATAAPVVALVCSDGAGRVIVTSGATPKAQVFAGDGAGGYAEVAATFDSIPDATSSEIAISGDGEYFAARFSAADVYYYRWSGSSYTKLGQLAFTKAPSFSPDGSLMVVTETSGANRQAVYLIDGDTFTRIGGSTDLTLSGVAGWAWAGDGTRLVGIDATHQSIQLWSVTDGAASLVSKTAAASGWNPKGIAISRDGRFIFVVAQPVSGNPVRVFEVIDGVITEITAPTDQPGASTSLELSATGSTLVVTQSAGGADFYVYTVAGGVLTHVSPTGLVGKGSGPCQFSYSAKTWP